MPNRIIKETICTSEDLDKLSNGAEILFYRLIVQADDYGCYFGNPSIVKSSCFPLRSDEISSEQVNSWLDELTVAGLIDRYVAEDGRQYLRFVKWNKHQRVRQTQAKFPQFAADCRELPQAAADCGRLPPNPIQSNPIQSESNTNTNAAKPRIKKQFVPPTLEEVQAYCKERNSTVDPKAFYEYFTADPERQWIDSEGKPVKSWKQKLITWEGRDRNGKPVSANAQESTADRKTKWGIKYDNET